MIFPILKNTIKKIFLKFESQIKNSSWLLFDSILKNFFSFLSSIFVARYLGPQRYGLLSYSLGFVGMFTSLITLGLDNLSIKEITGNKKNIINKVLGTTFLMKVLGYFTMTLIIVISTVFLRKNESGSEILIFITTIAYFFHTIFTIDYFFQSRLESRKTVVSKQIGIALAFLFKIVAIILKLPLIYFAIAFIIESAVTAIFLIISYQKTESILKWKVDKKILKFLFISSLPIIISGLINSFFRRFDQILIQDILGSAANGYYSISKKISESIYFIPTAISMSIFPTLVKNANNKNRFESIYMKTSSILFFTSIGIVFLIIIFSDFLIPLLFGEEYRESSNLLKISILAAPFVFLDSLNNRWILIYNKQKYYIFASLAALINTIVVNSILLRKFGIIGAAITYPISWFINSFFVYLIIPATRKGVLLQIKSIVMTPIFIKEKLFKTYDK